MRHDSLLEIGDSRDRADFEARLVRLSLEMGFDRMSCFLAIERPDGSALVEIVENTPAGYVEVSRDLSFVRRCPVVRHVKRSFRPLIYDQSTYVSTGTADLWEQQAPFGYKSGVIVGVHMPQGRHLVFGVDRHQPIPKDERVRRFLESTVVLAASYAVEPALEFLGGLRADPEQLPRLTEREREVLRWIGAGKSTWVIGRIMSLSDSAVNFHIRNAMRKLDCNSRHLAARRAVALGLISP
jgi:DNA-binding CsgD family transcriptional regulator